MQLHQIPPDLVPDIARDAIALYREYRAFGADPDQAVAKAVAEVVEGCAVGVRE